MFNTRVPSDTRPGVTYDLRLKTDHITGMVDLTCTCEGYKHRKTCKHTARVAARSTEPCGCGGHMTFTPKSTMSGFNTLSCDACEFTIYC